MARKKGKTKTEQSVTDYRHEEAKRLHIPPAGLAAQGKIREKPKIQYAYNPHLPPILRFDRTGKADGLPELLEIALTLIPAVAQVRTPLTSLTKTPYLHRMPQKFTFDLKKLSAPWHE